MKYGSMMLTVLLLIGCLLLPTAADAQRVEMEEQALSFDYPDSWLVISPQLAYVMEPLLAQAGFSAGELSGEMEKEGVLSRAISPDNGQTMSILVRTDEDAQQIYDIDEATEEQRRRMRSRWENDAMWERTGLRVRDAEWQRENGSYWLYLHYIVTYADETVGRGLRYVTVKNGMYVMLDWRIAAGRFGNRDLNAFRARIADLTIGSTGERPVRDTVLEAEIPAETSVQNLRIAGKATPGAALTFQIAQPDGSMHTAAVGEASGSGSFTLEAVLEKEGTYDVMLTAMGDGMRETQMQGRIVYSARTLPVTLSGIPQSGIVTTDTVTVTGQTLAGVQMQLITPFGMSKKRSAADGSFSFELTTKKAGEYTYTLICDKDGYDQRRVPFAFTREVTQAQENAQLKREAERISYANLQKDREADRGKVMSLYGPVTQVSSAQGVYYVRMNYTKNAQGQWSNPVILVSETDTGAKVGDMLRVVVRTDGVFEEQNSLGESVAIPRLTVEFVEGVE